MAKFDQDTLRRLHDAQEVVIRTEKHPDAPVTIWVVAPGDDVYVRSVRAAKGRRFTDLAKGGDATLEMSGRRVAVKAIPATDPVSVDRATGEYLRKYRTSPYAQAMVKPQTLPTTLRLEPRSIANSR
jgi:hypothetical protein